MVYNLRCTFIVYVLKIFCAESVLNIVIYCCQQFIKKVDTERFNIYEHDEN